MNLRRYTRMCSVSLRRRNPFQYFLLLVALLLVPAIAALRVQADVAVFLSDIYEEETVIESEGEGEGALVRHQHRWSGFQGTVPELAPIEQVELVLVWSLGDSLIENLVETLTPTIPVEENGREGESEVLPEHEIEDILPSSALEGEGAAPTEDSSEDVLQEIVPSLEDVPEDVSLPPEETPESTPEEEAKDPDTVPVVRAYGQFMFANALIEETVDEAVVQSETVTSEEGESPVEEEEDVSEEIVVEEAVDSPDPSQVPSQVLGDDTVPHGEAEDALEEGSLPVEVVEDQASESLPTESLTVTSVLTPEEGAVELASSTLPVVRYSLDGMLWTTLGVLDLSHSGSARFDLSHLALEELPSLRVVVEYRASESAEPVVFKQVQLDVAYGEPVLEEVLPLGPSDQEPNFLISAIVKDVTSGNIRAVILERGGMYEFWYSLAAVNADEVSWQRLAGGGVIDGNTPVAIEKRTIFWVDRNQQTLFGYAVDSASLFGTPIASGADGVARLTFTDARERLWQVVYTPHDNELTFERTDDRSP